MTTTRHIQDNGDHSDNADHDVYHDVPLNDDDFLDEDSSNKQLANKCLSNTSFFSKPPIKHIEEIEALLLNPELKFKTDPADDYDAKNQAAAKRRGFCQIV